LAEEVTGILDYSYGNYKVNVFGLVHFTGDEPEVPIIENSEEPLSILSYNVENLPDLTNQELETWREPFPGFWIILI